MSEPRRTGRGSPARDSRCVTTQATTALRQLSREVLAAVGWVAPHPDGETARRVISYAAALDPLALPEDTHRRILAVLLEQLEEDSATTWSRVMLELQRRADADACRELVHVATADGFALTIDGHVQLLTDALDARQRTAELISELGQLMGGPVHVHLRDRGSTDGQRS